jgi:predicted DsbA family dithiol-disulfide isomerase
MQLGTAAFGRFNMRMEIHIYTDTICPRCYIGNRHLDAALQNLGDPVVDIRWHAYQLYPDIPRGGVPRREFMRARFGERAGSGAGRIQEAGRAAGIEFAFDRLEKIPNTFDSHRLLEFAAEQGRQHQAVESLFEAGFENGQDIGEINVLLGVAQAADLDVVAARRALTEGSYTAEVDASLMWCQQSGITGVPFIRMGNGEVVHGAQPVAVMQMVVQSALEDSAQS